MPCREVIGAVKRGGAFALRGWRVRLGIVHFVGEGPEMVGATGIEAVTPPVWRVGKRANSAFLGQENTLKTIYFVRWCSPMFFVFFHKFWGIARMADLSRIGDREKLKPRNGNEPHWHRLRQGVYLG
jgi:hypothetical protein